MNYANMIEEKNLKKTFIIATLCSTLVGTFTSSIGLWDRVNQKRTQKRRDIKQDEEIKKLRDQVQKSDQRNKDYDDESSRKSERRNKDRDDDSSRKSERRNKDRDDDSSRRRSSDDVGDSFERSGMMIQREFDQGYDRLGRRWAVGDTITENQLQAQIISLQQTVINVLQDALANNRTLTRADMDKLMLASQAAREGSLDALRSQYDRLSEDAPPQRALPPPKRASTVVEPDSVFCRYSLDLQYVPKKPLSASFAPGGDGRCPDCGARLNIDGTDVWHIGKRTPVIVVDGRYEKEILEDREFHLGQRFVIKCHTTDGEFACILCNKHRDVDVLCGSVETLVNHVGRNHDITELEKEIDLREKSFPLALPRAPSPPREIDIREKRLVEYR